MRRLALLTCFTVLPVFANEGLVTDIPAKLNRLAPVKLSADVSKLSKGDRQALDKLIAASRQLDPIFLRQVWSGNPALKEKLAANAKSRQGKDVFHFFQQNVGPWSRLDEGRPFIEGVPATKPLTAGFYPEDLTREEFENWIKGLSSADKASALGFFSLVKRDAGGKLVLEPYSKAYAEPLKIAGGLLKEAAVLTTNASLKKFLETRAAAFGTDDYYASDVAWMEIDAPIEMTIGPYETYEDGLFNYKAAFEAYVCIRNEAETRKLAKFGSHLQELENTLPIAPKYRNPKLGAAAPIRVVDTVFSSGDGRRGVMTAAFNLPNDERVVKEKGSKRVMLKNVQEAKFQKVLKPIAATVLSPADQKRVAFEAFFTHILTHELMHGLGPQGGRMQLKELYSAIEEAKADVTGLWAMHNLLDKGVVDAKMRDTMYTTYLASSFRSVRFGIDEAHGRGVALQFNYLIDEGAFVAEGDRFRVEPKKIRPAIEKLAGELLTIEAEGDYARAKALLTKYAVIRPAMRKALDRLQNVPTDIEPIYPLAGE